MKRYIIGGLVFLFVIGTIIDCTGNMLSGWSDSWFNRRVERLLRKGEVDRAHSLCMEKNEMLIYFNGVLKNLENMYVKQGYTCVHMALAYIPYPDPSHYSLTTETKRIWGNNCHSSQSELAERNNLALDNFATYLLYHDGSQYIADLLTFLQPQGDGESCDENVERILAKYADLPVLSEDAPVESRVPVDPNAVNLQDYLIRKTETYPIYVCKGDSLHFEVQLPQLGSIRLYNADSQKQLGSYQKKKEVSETIYIPNSAIYILEVVPQETQYAEVVLNVVRAAGRQTERYKKVYVDTVTCRKGDFRAESVRGIQMHNLFEEPRKFTLRGQLKASVSGSSKAVVALQVPQGATDVLYSLRIDTNERDKRSDGKFYDNMETSYHKIKFLGMPLYESQHGSGLIATLLGLNRPPRDEDAYINMYVFYDASQARKFQDGTPAKDLKYNVDYTTLGTQSCNGRIPSRGNKTIYLAFENERMRYNNYVWLEAISAVPTTEYFKEVYTVK